MNNVVVFSEALRHTCPCISTHSFSSDEGCAACAFGVLCEKPLPNLRSQRLMPVSRSLAV